MTQKNLITKAFDNTDSTGEVIGEAISMDYVQEGSIQSVITASTPANKNWTSSDVSTVNDTITITAHGFSTGLLGQATTAGTLPAPIVVSTDYYIINVDANTIKLATSLANALAGTAIDLTTTGSGTSTFSVTTLDAGLTYQINNDVDVNNEPVDGSWYDYQAEIPITDDSQEWFLITVPPGFKYLRYKYRVDAGVVSATNVVVMKGAQA